MTAPDGTVWLVIAVAGVGTFTIRASFLFLLGQVDGIPPRAERALRFVPAAVLAALVVPSFLQVDGGPLAAAPTLADAIAAFTGPKFLAGTVAAAVAYRTESILATIVVGLAALLGLELLLGP